MQVRHPEQACVFGDFRHLALRGGFKAQVQL